ncbi:hypothetical protein CFR80_08820 [Komagataeibacter oboediens]|uniref:Uncharacterized protein n=1 Tax=Komagataeibacter oboediens TaxID=65958 RepID=A0A318QX70_9PROT|nr:hypothetical protein CFR80_08820 [Komagataeibacter oboediens]
MKCVFGEILRPVKKTWIRSGKTAAWPGHIPVKQTFYVCTPDMSPLYITGTFLSYVRDETETISACVPYLFPACLMPPSCLPAPARHRNAGPPGPPPSGWHAIRTTADIILSRHSGNPVRHV